MITFEIFIPFIILLVLIFLSVPIGFSLGISGTIGLLMIGGWKVVLGIVGTAAFRDIATFSLSTVPLYLLMAEFIIQARLADPLFDFTYHWLGWMPGGVGVATVWANAGFGAISGSSTAAAATMGKVAYPLMRRLGYSDELCGGIISTGGTLAILIPPSIAMVVYGLATETSISKLFIAGIIPGLLMAAIYSIAIILWCAIKKEGKRAPHFTWKERFKSVLPVWPVLLLIFIVVGFLYLGIATATEVGAVGAAAALLLGVFMKRLSWSGLKKACLSALKGTAMIQTIILGAKVFGYYLTLTNFTQMLGDQVLASGAGRYEVLLFVIVAYFVLGMFMNNVSILYLLLPISYPLMMKYGFDPIWFGIICTICGEVGLISPPVGLNCYMVSEACNMPIEKVFKGATPLLLVPIITLVLIILFPEIATWLPSHMG